MELLAQTEIEVVVVVVAEVAAEGGGETKAAEVVAEVVVEEEGGGGGGGADREERGKKRNQHLDPINIIYSPTNSQRFTIPQRYLSGRVFQHFQSVLGSSV